VRGGLGAPPGAAPELRAPPVSAPAAAARGALPTVRSARPGGLLYVVLGVILTDVWRLHDLVSATRVARPSIALTAVGLVLLAAGGGAPHATHRLRSPVVLWFGVFLGLILAGLPFSLDPAQSARFLATSFLPHVVAGVLVAASVRSVSDAEFLALGTLVGACVHTLAVQATAVVGPDGRWADLPYYDVNDLALMLVAMIPLTLYFMRRASPTPRRLFAAACFALFAYAIVRTGSRGGFVGFAVVIGYLLLHYRAVPARARLIGAAVAVLALAVGGQAYLSRLGTIFRPTQDYNWSAETGRMAIWRRGVDYVADRPLVGLGLNQFRTAESRLWAIAREQRMAGRRPPPARGAHNMLLQVAAELGLPALIAFVLLLGAAWRTLTRGPEWGSADPAPERALPAALAASLLGFCVCGMFLHAAFFPILPLLLGLAVAIGYLSGSPVHPGPARRGGLFSPAQARRRAV
jgi:putative inorganic carbon (hco3(-)) transporter